jgi:phospholipase C
MQPVSRRTFLGMGVATGTGLYAGLGSVALTPARAWAAQPGTPLTPNAPRSTPPAPPAPGLRRPGSRPRPDLPEGTDTFPNIQHIVVLMMENHSFDNYLGVLGRGDGLTIGSDGRPTNANVDAAGLATRSFHMSSTCQQLHLSLQSWNASHVEFNGGRGDGFVRAAGRAAMGYLAPQDLPFYSALARTFPLSDRWFASCLGPTHPNRRFLIAGTAAGLVRNHRAVSSEPPPAGGTIFNLLDRHRLSWRNYYVTVPTAGLYMKAVARQSANLVPVTRFFADARAGTLPNFAIIDPDYRHNSEESPGDTTVGEAFSANVINAVMHSPAWSKTVLIWCYDEHGGYYDHVRPPPAIRPDHIAPQLMPGDTPGAFDRYGFRVPAVVVSPYSRPNYVSHVVHDHTSILKLVETKWNLPAMTYRDANASDLLDCLDLSRAAFAVPPRLPPPANPRAISRCPAPPPGKSTARLTHDNPISNDDIAPTTVAAPTRQVAHVDNHGVEVGTIGVVAATVVGATAATAVVGRSRLFRMASGQDRPNPRHDATETPGDPAE